MNENTVTQKKGLDLTPNEVVGYRITPELNNWTISLVKRRVDGTEYRKPMTYHKTIYSAVSWIFNNVSQLEGQALQKEVALQTGEVGNAEILKQAFERGLKAALESVEALEKDIQDAGIPLKGLAGSLAKAMKTDESLTHIINGVDEIDEEE